MEAGSIPGRGAPRGQRITSMVLRGIKGHRGKSLCSGMAKTQGKPGGGAHGSRPGEDLELGQDKGKSVFHFPKNLGKAGEPLIKTVIPLPTSPQTSPGLPTPISFSPLFILLSPPPY